MSENAPHIQIWNKTEKILLFPGARKALRLADRLRGLLGSRELLEEEGLFFPKCNSIHTFFMSFPIDAVFLKKGGIVRIIESLKPGRILFCSEADSVLEIRAGESRRKNLKHGDILVSKRAGGEEEILV